MRYLRGGRWRGTASRSPHLLKLYPDFCKCFDDDSDKYILKENHKPRLLKTGDEEAEGNRKQTRSAETAGKQILLGRVSAVPSQARPGRRWAWWSRSRTAIGGSCRSLCTWGTPSLPGTRPRRPWICWCLSGHRRADRVTAGSGNGETLFRKTINSYPRSFSQWQKLF